MWGIQLLLSLLAVTSIFQIGFLVDYYLIARFKSSSNIFIFYALGLGSIAIFQIIISLFGISLNKSAVFTLILLSFLPLFIDSRIREKLLLIFSDLGKSIKNLQPLLSVLTIIFITVITVLTFSHLVWGYDAWGFWLSKSRAFWIDGMITRSNLYLYWPYDHPLLWPLVSTWFYQIIGEGAQFWIRIIPLFTYISLVGIFSRSLPKRNKWNLGWITVLALTPFVWGNVVFVEYGGNADLLLSFYFLLAVTTLAVKSNAIYASLFLAFAILTKNDALPAMVSFIIILPFIIQLSKSKKESLVAWIIAVGFLIFDIFWKNYYGFTNRYQQQSLNVILTSRSLIKYTWYTLHAFREEFRQLSRWGIGWWLILFSLVTHFKKVWQNKWLMLGFLLMVTQLLVYIWIYYITPENQAEHITTSIFRLALQLYPSMLYIASYITTSSP